LRKTQNQEEFVWHIYNSTRNIESIFRCLKTDLGLRPVYPKTDESSEAHLHLGLLAYWIVNTQKIVTTSVENDKNQTVKIRKCSEPKEKVAFIYLALGYKQAPFIRKKSVVPKPPNLKNNFLVNRWVTDE
jgi:transposase